MLTQLADGLVIVDAAGTLTYANPAFLALHRHDQQGDGRPPGGHDRGGTIRTDGFAQLEAAALAGQPWLQSLEPDRAAATRAISRSA